MVGRVNPTANVAIGIVTFNRSRLLDGLLASVAKMTVPPARVIVVDNASSDKTREIIDRWAKRFGPDVLVSRRFDTNTGGSGGFSEVARVAVELGVDWVWLMDDDVEIVPDALEQFAPWMERFEVIHGRRYDVDGTPFYWQARFNQFLGVPLPYSSRMLKSRGYAITDSGTFEGMLIATRIIRQIGTPDPRFFISWDDAIYAWLSAQVTKVVYVDAFVMRKKRRQKQANLGFRHMNESSALVKYHVMRNRAHVGRYFQAHGKLNRVGFGLGTALTFVKEVFRLVVVEHSLSGFGALIRGWRDGRAIWADKAWQPMPPIPEGTDSQGDG